MVCIDPAQARVIWKSLQQFEALKPEVRALRRTVDTLHAANHTLLLRSRADSAQASSYKQALGTQERLTVDADNRATIAQLKARKRGWLSAGLGALLVVVTGLAVSH
ncbi:hypothetical protein [Hymenobacter glacieicola]|uniref:Uncharacterized protein n=1 Tax=Hymenobacter glacieicola TaxID=1562124 RepID=A0ABQ1X7Z5_9BACT|nr:hypothetical protein [Hymenobacter glacieicola]GGG60674.1 hypothetical protein GCM10011378_40870 [Hymenobacter glacieicola]